jgi:hypothetical protein
MESLLAEVVENHIRFHVIEQRRGANAVEVAEQLIDLVRTYFR